MDIVQIFDTTLRDGEQSPGASMSLSQKLEIALQLEKLGVDCIEAGFPISSPHQFDACKKISETVKNSTIAVLARSTHKDLDAAAESIRDAARPRIHTFISTSPIHMKYKLKMDPETVLERIKDSVQYARNLVPEVEFSPEDATRTEFDFLCKAVEIAVRAGATIINIPDTVGYTISTEYHNIITLLKERIPGMENVILSTHCHNDLGLAVSNSLAAVQAGARQIEVTINGIGERAGNTALEEVVMALYVRRDVLNVETNIQTKYLYPTSRLLSHIVGFPIARNKAVVGENAFAHEAGIHQDGMLKNRETYEIMTPEVVGRSESKIVLGRHSGKHGLKHRLKQLEISVPEENFEKLYENFTDLADKKKEIFDEDLYSLISTSIGSDANIYELTELNVVTETGKNATASVTVKSAEEVLKGSATGDGPVAAIFVAIEKAMGISPKLVEFDVQAITPGKQSIGEASVIITHNNKKSAGRGSSTDIVEASAIAYLNAISHSMLL